MTFFSKILSTHFKHGKNLSLKYFIFAKSKDLSFLQRFFHMVD